MNYYELENDEQELLDSVEQGKFKPIQEQSRTLTNLAAAVKLAGNKTRNSF